MYSTLAGSETHDTLYAGFWLRFFALILDQLLFGIVFTLLLIIAGAIFVLAAGIPMETLQAFFDNMMTISAASSREELGDLRGSPEEMAYYLSNVFYFACYLIYHAACEASRLQGSVGKRLLKIKVTRIDGTPHGFFRAFARNILAVVLGIATLSVSHWFAGFTKKKQALHDMITGCLVVARTV
jgi:uncharacterized RDD family membrane protein YckC